MNTNLTKTKKLARRMAGLRFKFAALAKELPATVALVSVGQAENHTVIISRQIPAANELTLTFGLKAKLQKQAATSATPTEPRAGAQMAPAAETSLRLLVRLVRGTVRLTWAAQKQAAAIILALGVVLFQAHSFVAFEAHVVDITAELASVNAPTFVPSQGYFPDGSPVSVTIEDSDPDATHIFYTMANGTDTVALADPNCETLTGGPKPVGPISIISDTVLKAIGCSGVGSDAASSTITTAVYEFGVDDDEATTTPLLDNALIGGNSTSSADNSSSTTDTNSSSTPSTPTSTTDFWGGGGGGGGNFTPPPALATPPPADNTNIDNPPSSDSTSTDPGTTDASTTPATTTDTSGADTTSPVDVTPPPETPPPAPEPTPPPSAPEPPPPADVSAGGT